MQKSLSFLVLLFIFSNGYSQIESYDISDYLFPDVNRKALQLNPFLDFTSSNSRNFIDYDVFDIGTDIFGSELDYNRKRQLDLFYQLNLGYTSGQNPQTTFNYQDEFYAAAQVNIANRLFLKPRRFFELAGGGRFAFDPDYTFAGENRDEVDINVSIAPKIGFGRTEIITDAWHAVTILEELQKGGVLDKEISHEEITALADELRRLKNYRNVDFRLEDLYELESLARYMVENKFSTPEQYKFFALLNDAYRFEAFERRFQGTTFKVGLNANLSYFDNDFITKRTQTSRTYGLIAEYENRNAINNDWQFDQIYAVQAGRLYFSPIDTEQFFDDYFVQLNATLSLGYFFSQRTNIRIPLFASYRKQDSLESYNYSISLNPTLVYYVSPQLRFSARGRFNLAQTSNVNVTLIDYQFASLSAGMSYFFY